MHRTDAVALQLLESPSTELWSMKYFPQTKKEIPLFRTTQIEKFEAIVRSAFARPTQGKRIILVTGPVGCGKSTVVKTICTLMNIEIVQFNPDDFVERKKGQPRTESIFLSNLKLFLERSQLVINTYHRRILLLDDLAIERKEDYPHVIRILTEYNNNPQHKFPLIWIPEDCDLVSKPSPCIVFNIPSASATVLKRILNRVSTGEGFKLSKEQIDALISDNSGDIRLAVNNLQFSRDFTPGKLEYLSYFQAIGEVLYNKKKRSAEDLLKQSHVTPSRMISALYENYQPFYTVIEEQCEAAYYFSEADEFMAMNWCNPELGELGATIAMRGIITTNNHPANLAFWSFKPATHSHLKYPRIPPDEPFKCWPRSNQSIIQMENELFEEKSVYEYTYTKISHKEEPLTASQEELTESMQLLSIDPIDDSGMDEFFGRDIE